TLADLHSAIVAAIGALKGPLHGGANEKVMEILEAAGSPDRAEAWLRQSLARKERIMGFGHRVYKTGDVRAGILKPYARKAAEASTGRRRPISSSASWPRRRTCSRTSTGRRAGCTTRWGWRSRCTRPSS